jgi:hypothetical protein
MRAGGSETRPYYRNSLTYYNPSGVQNYWEPE